MKAFAVFTVIALSVAAPARAAERPATQVHVGPTYSTMGVVDTVSDGIVRIDHQPVAELNWPAMTMSYEVPRAAMTANLQPGAQVRFSFRREGFGYVLTDIAPQ